MEAIPQILTFLGLVFMIFLIITTFKLSSTIAELRGKIMYLEETLDSKNKELRHKRTYIDELQAKLQRLEKYHAMYQAPAPAPEIKAYKSVRLMSEIEKGRSIGSDKFFISQNLRRAAEPYIEWTEGAGGGLRGILTVYTIDNE